MVESRDALVESARGRFAERFSRRPEWIGVAPGRVNLIGEHTDYTEGLALPAAIDRWAAVALAPRSDRRLRVFASDLGELFERELDDLVDDADVTGWRALAAGAVAVVAERHDLTRGFDVSISATIPRGSGLSSSAALVVALLNGLRAATGAGFDDLELVEMARRVENEYLGLSIGLLDPMASQFCRSGHAMRVDFRTLERIQVPLEAGEIAWLLADSGVRRELAKSAYDDRVAECARGWRLVRAAHPDLKHLREADANHLAALGDTARVERARLSHFVGENRRVDEMVATLGSGDWSRAGELLLLSHASLRDLYEVSCPELDQLVEAPAGVAGWLGARMIGGGFGGSILHLIRHEARDAVVEALEASPHTKSEVAAPVVEFTVVGGAEALAREE